MRKTLIIAGAIVAVSALGAGAWVLQRLGDVPTLDVHAQPFPATGDEPGPDASRSLRVTYLGVTTMLFDDGETAFLTDGFFSRPGFRRVATSSLTPDVDGIGRVLERIGVEELAAVVPLHAHFDHAMDAPTVAELTGARVIGSESVTNIARGHLLPEDRIQLIEDGETVELGQFRLRFIESVHAPGDRAAGIIKEPLTTPAHATAYRTGTVYSLLVEHQDRRILVNSSAGFLPGKLAGHQADVVYLGIGDLGFQDEAYRQAYWDEVVAAVGAKRVVLTHWDDLFEPLGERLKPAPRLYQDHAPAMVSLYALKQRDGVELRLPRAFVAADPFSGLPEPADEEPPLRLRRLPGYLPAPTADDDDDGVDGSEVGTHQSVGR